MSNFQQYKYQDTLTKKSKALRLLWGVIWFCLFKANPRWMLNGWRIFLLRCFGARIGSGCKVSPSCFVWAPWNLQMGDYSVLGDNVDCYTMDKIIIGSKVAISQRAFLCTGTHDTQSLLRPLITRPIIINDHVWVCAEAFVGPGVELGRGAVVAARAVVMKNTKDMDVVAGNPAVFIKKRALRNDSIEY